MGDAGSIIAVSENSGQSELVFLKTSFQEIASSKLDYRIASFDVAVFKKNLILTAALDKRSDGASRFVFQLYSAIGAYTKLVAESPAGFFHRYSKLRLFPTSQANLFLIVAHHGKFRELDAFVISISEANGSYSYKTISVASLARGVYDFDAVKSGDTDKLYAYATIDPTNPNFNFSEPQIARMNFRVDQRGTVSTQIDMITPKSEHDYLLTNIAVALGKNTSHHLIAVNTIGTRIIRLEVDITKKVPILLVNLNKFYDFDGDFLAIGQDMVV